MRWHSLSLGFVSPGEFIPIAEETGDIIDIGYWVVMEVCRHIKALNESAKTNATLAVNISGRHLGQTDFEEQLFSIIDSWGLAPSAIKLELTETVLVEDIDNVKAKMDRLRSLGIRFSIDDFGTGYSSLSYLQSMPISELKIDRTFVSRIDAEEIKGREIVDLIIQMAKSLNVRTVAQGVETEEQLNYLKTKGYDLYQAFLLAKPIPINEWKREVKSHSDQY